MPNPRPHSTRLGGLGDADDGGDSPPKTLPEGLKQGVLDMGWLIREQRRQYRHMAQLVNRQQQMYTELETDNKLLRAKLANELGSAQMSNNVTGQPCEEHTLSNQLEPHTAAAHKEYAVAEPYHKTVIVAEATNGTNMEGQKKSAPGSMRPSDVSMESAHSPAHRSSAKEHDSTMEHNNPPPPRSLFADAETMKNKMKEELGKPEYDVTTYYHTEGIMQRIARSSMFDTATLCVIALNALWLAVDTDYNPEPTLVSADAQFVVVENLFCFYFTGEWITRFLSFRHKANCIRDFWFVFDSILCFLMVLETWLMPLTLVSAGLSGDNMGNAALLKMVRLLRLTRMGRMARLLRANPELLILVKGLGVATKSVIFTLALLVIIVYFFAVVLVQMLGPYGLYNGSEIEDRFWNVPTAMNELLLSSATPDQAELVIGIMDVSLFLYPIIIAFLLLAGITVMNMLVGILVEVISVVSAVEKESLLLQGVRNHLKDLMEDIGLSTEPGATISKDEFNLLLHSPGAAKALAEVGVDCIALVDLTDFLFMSTNSYTFASLMDVVLNLRGTNSATVKDILDLRKVMNQDMRALFLQQGEAESVFS